MSSSLSGLTRSPSLPFEERKTICENEKEPKAILLPPAFTVKASIKLVPMQLANISLNLDIINSEEAGKLVDRVNAFVSSQQTCMHKLFVCIIQKFPISDLLVMEMAAYKTVDGQIGYMDKMITHLQKVSPRVDATVTMMQKCVNTITKLHYLFIQQKTALEKSFPEKIAQATNFKKLIQSDCYFLNIIPTFNRINNENGNFLEKIFIF